MVVNFPVTDPSDPNYSHTHTEPNGVTWTWDGEKWRVSNNSSGGGGGAPADINLQEVTENGATTDNVVDFQSGAIVSGGQLQLPGGGNDTDALQRQEVVSLINNNQTVTDGRYLRLDSGAGAQSVESTAGVTLKGLTTHEAGINVAGGTAATANIYQTGEKYIQFGGNNRTVATFAVDVNDVGNGIAFGDATCQLSTTESDINLIKSAYYNGGHGGGQNLALINNSVEVDTSAQRVCLYQADSGAQQSGKLYAYYSGVSTSDSSDKAYSFYAAGDAPNFFAGKIDCEQSVNGFGVSSRGNITGPNWGGNQYAAYYAKPVSVTGAVGSQGFTADSIPAGSDGNAIHFFSRGTDSDDNNNYAFRTSFNTSVGTGQNWAFYASGTARSYFNGNITVSVGTDDSDITIDNTGDRGTSLMAGTQAGRILSSYNNGNASSALRYYTRTGSDKGQIVRFYYAATPGAGSSTNCGNIVLTSANSINFESSPSDYRLKSNVNPMGSAVDVIKALKPYTFEFTNDPGVVHQGFFAHELQEQVPMAVSGTKDATEAIGTYTDVDGNVETEVTEPEAIPYGASWSQTGTRDVYQGLDQTKLIPLLTKALQEALEEIDTLKTRLSDAGIA